jgi:hypothetical protein
VCIDDDYVDGGVGSRTERKSCSKPVLRIEDLEDLRI